MNQEQTNPKKSNKIVNIAIGMGLAALIGLNIYSPMWKPLESKKQKPAKIEKHEPAQSYEQIVEKDESNDSVQHNWKPYLEKTDDGWEFGIEGSFT